MIARNPQFAGAQELYQGANKSYFLSGLRSGTYYLMLRDGSGHQSHPIELTVTHQSLARAILLTIVGAFITLAIVATIIRGARP